jgi:hypothetical protein
VTAEKITIVTGLPRSGTSMMMQILAAGGMEVLTDQIRAADEDNPRGYYEIEKIKDLSKDSSLLDEAAGKAVKIITKLLIYLPSEHSYQIIFVDRKLEEVLASQKMMLMRRGKHTDAVDDKKLSDLFSRHLKDTKKWISNQPNMDVFYTNYNEIITSPLETLSQINHFLGDKLDLRRMAGVVDKSLYRQVR